MLDFFVNNWGTLLAGVIVLAVVILVIVGFVLLRQDVTMKRQDIRSPIKNKNGVHTRNFTLLIVF